MQKTQQYEYNTQQPRYDHRLIMIILTIQYDGKMDIRLKTENLLDVKPAFFLVSHTKDIVSSI